ncbi:trace amine-associated receptor 13c-like [Lepisosteus oculatus]|uniref:trace amine-associated receptor 13c-like n=1 Tax=Lepisosteus oculatus TaxID=7918 RepID=UPI00073FFDD7|nr:PREDICTED: trace amine-associated receptor 13c-like [Lepisosteus oculatus]
MDFNEHQENRTIQYCFHSGNTSCLKKVRPTAVNVILYFFLLAVVFLTVCGNLLVIISISHFKQLHTPTNLLVLSLAVADFLIGVTVMPFTMIQSVESCWYFGDTFCTLYSVLILLLTSVSVSSLVFIAIDRFFAVCDPLLYSTKITVNVIYLVISLSWFLSLLYALSIIYSKGNIDGDEALDTCQGDCLFTFNATWGLIDLVMTFLLPSTFMITLYAKIFIVAKRHARVISSASAQVTSGDRSKSKTSNISERKAAKTLGLVLLVFLLCWIPYHLCTIIDSYINFSVPSDVINTLAWLVYINSSINPLIYALFYPWFQKSVKLIITFRICYTASSLINLYPENV